MREGWLVLSICVLLLPWVLQARSGPVSSISFSDVSSEAGLKIPIIYGDIKRQKYILESTGTGVAIFDYDADGRAGLWPLVTARCVSVTLVASLAATRRVSLRMSPRLRD